MTEKSKFLKVDHSPEEAEKKRQEELHSLVQSCIIDPTEPITEPPTVVWFNGSPVCQLGSFTLWTGKAKARKTFLLSSVVAAALGRSNIDCITSTMPPDFEVHYFDTEQPEHRVRKLTKRIIEESGTSENLHVYMLRSLPPADRVNVIDHVIQSLSTTAFIVIDGIRDLLSIGINDEREATTTATRLMQWTDSKFCHISVVLHQNKGATDTNARGHVGTELVNKAEAVISVTKDQNDPLISTVQADYCRDLEFSPFAFTINERGLPETLFVNPNKNKDERKLQNMHESFEQLLPGMVALSYTQLFTEYVEVAAVSERTAKRHIGEAIKKKIITKDAYGNYRMKNISQFNEEVPF